MKKLPLLIFMMFFALPLWADQATAIKSGCFGCHQVDKKTVGPSIKELSAKIKGQNIDDLVAYVKAGSKPGELKWGQVPMPPNASPEADIRKVLDWMMTH